MESEPIVDKIRRLRQEFPEGDNLGDYVYDRDVLFENMTVDDIVEEIKRQREKAE